MICELHESRCDLCELTARDVRSASSYYFAGLIAGLYLQSQRTHLCKYHYGQWQKFEREMKKEPLVPADAAH